MSSKHQRPMVFVVAAQKATPANALTLCYDGSGEATKVRRRWKYFKSVESAIEWSDKIGIALDGERCFIAAQSYSDNKGIS